MRNPAASNKGKIEELERQLSGYKASENPKPSNNEPEPLKELTLGEKLHEYAEHKESTNKPRKESSTKPT